MDMRSGMTKGDRTRQRVLGQAARLFARHGYNGVSMERLAKALKLTKGAVYAHFSGKYEIYLESMVAYLDKCILGRPVLDPGGDPEANLEQYLGWLLTSFERDRTYRMLMLRLFIEADEKTTRLVAERAMESPVSQLSELIRRYRPDIDALEFVYTFSAIAMLNPDLKKTMAVFNRGPAESSSRSTLEHLMGIIRAM